MQVLVHCNGDQAVQHYMDQYQRVHQQDIRPVIIHAQMMRPEQMNQAKDLHMIPSFFYHMFIILVIYIRKIWVYKEHSLLALYSLP